MSIDIDNLVNEGINYLKQKDDLTEEEIDMYTYTKLNMIHSILNDGEIVSEENLKLVNNKIKTR